MLKIIKVKRLSQYGSTNTRFVSLVDNEVRNSILPQKQRRSKSINAKSTIKVSKEKRKKKA